MTVSWSRMWSLEVEKSRGAPIYDVRLLSSLYAFEIRLDLLMWEVSKCETSRMTPKCAISSARWTMVPWTGQGRSERGDSLEEKNEELYFIMLPLRCLLELHVEKGSRPLMYQPEAQVRGQSWGYI